MNKLARSATLAAAIATACGVSYAAGGRAQQPSRQESLEGHVYQAAGGTSIKVLLDGQYRDVPMDVGEITFPADSRSGDHPHPVTEALYVLEGRLEHVVNGESTILEPGMLGFVRPPDVVNHVIPEGAGPTKALVIWSPAGEAARITSRWTEVR